MTGRGRKLTSKDAAIIRITLDILKGEYGEKAKKTMHAQSEKFFQPEADQADGLSPGIFPAIEEGNEKL